MTGSGLLTAAVLGAAYLSSLALLLRWSARIEGSHVLAIARVRPTHCAGPGLQARVALFTAAASIVAAALLALEAKALAFIGSSRVPGMTCPPGWLPAPACTLEVASSQPGAGTASAILLVCAAMMLAARRSMYRSALYPLACLLLGIAAFGAAADLASGSDGRARPQLAFRMAAGLQLTAAAGFVLTALVLRVRSIAAMRRCVLAHLAGACVRLLGALSMLALWPFLPRASAAALLVVMLLVPGVATALTGATAMASPPPEDV
ncbi:MAG: hypothetical protein KJZ80_07285 [Hyphomicrobiaceae bacterium]|nr:hypothetical protein [Hyphomicrobiaceae bacterium]